MYFITCDGEPLYDPRVENLHIIQPKLTLEVNKTGSFDFTIYPSHPLFDSIYKLKSVIEIYQDNVLIFRGRVLSDTLGFKKNRDIICEGDLAFFNDSIMRPYDFTGSVSDFLSSILSSHNSQVEADKQFTPGNVTVTDPNGLIVRSAIDYAKSWEVLNDKLIDLLGGYIILRRENNINYLDYLADSSNVSNQVIELGSNLLDVIKETRADDLITALIPLGAKLLDESGNETSERLTVSSVNGDTDFIYNQAAVDEYGWIFGTHVWEDVTLASNLLTKGTEYLNTLIYLGVSITLKAIDLSMVDVDADKLKVFEYVKVTSAPHGIDITAMIDKLEIYLQNPEKNTVTIGFGYETFTDKQATHDKEIQKIKTSYATAGEVVSVNENLAAVIIISQNQTLAEVANNYVSETLFASHISEVTDIFGIINNDIDANMADIDSILINLGLGGIDSSGSNPNGRYIKLKDGTLMQWLSISVTDQAIDAAYGTLFKGDRTWTFPIAFVEIPSVNCSQFDYDSTGSWGSVHDVSTTQATLSGIDTTSRTTGGNVTISAIAIGRWQ